MAPVKVAQIVAAFFLVLAPPAYGAPIVDTRFGLATGVRGLEVNELILDVRFSFLRSESRTKAVQHSQAASSS